MILAAGRANVDPWLDLGFQADFQSGTEADAAGKRCQKLRAGTSPSPKRSARPGTHILASSRSPVADVGPSQPRSPRLPTPPTHPSIAVRNDTGKKTPPFEVKTGKERFLDSGWVKLGGVCYSGVITTVNEDREILESWNGSGRKGPLKVILNGANRQKSTQINPLGVDANPLQAS